MAQEGSEASVASSSPAANWWEMNINPMASWNAMNHRWQQQQQPPAPTHAPQSLNMNPHSHSSCEEEISISNNSFTNNASNHSGLSVDSSSAAADHAAENHLWSQVLLGVGNSGDMHRSHGDGEKFLEILSSKSLATQIFDPACDYLKKLDSSWEFTSNSSSLNTFEKQLNTYNATNMIESERLTNNLSDLVSNWSIAPPNPNLDHHQISPSTCINVSMNPNSMSYATSHVSDIKNEFPADFQSYLHHEVKGENQHGHEIGSGSAETSLLRSTFNISAGLGCQIGLNNSVIGLNNSGLMADIPWSSARNLADIISFSSLNKPAMEFRGCKPSPKGSASSESSKKAGHENSTKGSGRGSGTTSEGKKKRTEDSSETLFKKSKHESSSNTPPLKLQGPKVKLGDRITALQQIVSPFGKTDTASVLLEAINYIRFLQEQVQLLSDPYFKSSANKDHNSWGSLERKDKAEQKLDLRSRGLCLVPISCTPQAYRENNGPDYWTPPYRGCLYR